MGGPHTSAWRLLLVLPLASALLGCAGDPELALVNPAKYDYHDCAQLQRAMQSDRQKADKLDALQQKAARTSEGAVIGRITYGPEYASTVGDMKVIERVSREKNCNPPIVAGAAAH